MSEIVSQLKALKLRGMAVSYAELLGQGANASLQMSDWLIKQLIEAECVLSITEIDYFNLSPASLEKPDVLAESSQS